MFKPGLNKFLYLWRRFDFFPKTEANRFHITGGGTGPATDADFAVHPGQVIGIRENVQSKFFVDGNQEGTTAAATVADGVRLSLQIINDMDQPFSIGGFQYFQVSSLVISLARPWATI